MIVIAAQLLAVAAQAAVPPGNNSKAVPCKVVDASRGREPIADLYLECASGSARLGSAASYISSINVMSGKILVIRQNGARSDASLGASDDAGKPSIQDVSSEIAHAAASGGILPGLRRSFDLTLFAVTGRITLTAVTTGTAKTVSVDLSPHL